MFEDAEMHDRPIIALLSDAVGEELEAVHQYLYFHVRLEDLGLTALASLFERVAIEEMRHIDRLAERILSLNGEVELLARRPVKKLAEPDEMLAEAIRSERQGVRDHGRLALRCADLADAASCRVFEALVADDERHARLFEEQRAELRRLGVGYAALQTFSWTDGSADE
jgi:bacterioferritin